MKSKKKKIKRAGWKSPVCFLDKEYADKLAAGLSKRLGNKYGIKFSVKKEKMRVGMMFFVVANDNSNATNWASDDYALAFFDGAAVKYKGEVADLPCP